MASDFPPRVRWCLMLAAPLVWPDRDELGGYALIGVHRARGADELQLAATSDLARDYQIATRADLIAWVRTRVHGGGGEPAWELARVVAAVGRAYWAAIMTETDALDVVLLAGKLVQQRYRSWDDFAAALLRGAAAHAEREASRQAVATELDGVVAALLADGGLWRELPWQLELGVTLVDPAAGARRRVLAAACETCGGRPTRPSPSAYVYCEFCGALVGYDFEVALATPAERPGPAYEALLAAHRDPLVAARTHGDDVAYERIQRELFDAWIDASPSGTPVRVKDPTYRAAYVAYLAELETRAAFDDGVRAATEAMQARVRELQFVDVGGGRVRIPSERFAPFADAVFAYEARRDAVFVAAGTYAHHPDRASRELQRRIGWSMMVQGYLPYLDEADAQALLARTALTDAYLTLPAAEPGAARALPCAHCGATLTIAAGAKRIVCEHCGRRIDVVG